MHTEPSYELWKWDMEKNEQLRNAHARYELCRAFFGKTAFALALKYRGSLSRGVLLAHAVHVSRQRK